MTKSPSNNDNWDDYQQLVVYRLDEMSKRIEALTECQVQMRLTLGALQLKSSWWGAVGGALAGIGAAIVAAFWPHKP